MKSADWTKWSAVAEIVSSIAILITLIYLAVQTQQNTDAVQAASRQGMLEQDRQSLYRVMEYPFLNQRTNLSQEQEVQLTAYLLAFLRMRENHWVQFENGLLDETTWAAYRNALVPVIFSSRFGRELWRKETEERHEFAQGFVENVNEWIAGIDLPDNDDMFPKVQPTN